MKRQELVELLVFGCIMNLLQMADNDNSGTGKVNH